MSCSHAMIILCGVCTEQTVFAPSSSAEQSAHCVMCRATAVIMAIMSSPRPDWRLFFFMVRTKEPDREGEIRRKRQRESWPAAQLQGGVDLWRVEGEERKYTVDRFVHIYIFIWLYKCVCKGITSTGARWGHATPHSSKSCFFSPAHFYYLSVVIMSSHYIFQITREVLIKMLIYLFSYDFMLTEISLTSLQTCLPMVLPLRLHTVCSTLLVKGRSGRKSLPIYYKMH